MAIPDGRGGELNGETTKSGLSRSGVINQAISAIAADDAELSRIIGAESEKLRYAANALLRMNGDEPAIDGMLRVSENVRQTLQAVINLQMLSLNRLSELLEESPVEVDKSPII